MKPDSHSEPSVDQTGAGTQPPLLPAAGLPTLPPPPPDVAVSSPPLAPQPTGNPLPVESTLALVLSLGLGLFLADAVVSLVDDTLILWFDLHLLTALRGILFLFALLVGAVIYVLIGLSPRIPKRWFLPLTLFNPVAGLVVVPLLIYFYARMATIAWGISFCQVVLGVTILYWSQRGFKLRWPLVPESRLAVRNFSWRHLSGFLLLNIFVLGPAVLGYLGFCAALAVNHFSDGFVALRPTGLTVQVRKYVRDDGKTIQLFPMSHIGEAAFYQQLSLSFPTNSLILMEGVTDNQNLLTNKITYQRMAASLGVAEQQAEFKPRGEMVMADVDVEQFTTNTIACLNLVMLLHSQGFKPETARQLMQFSPPHFEEQLFDDLLRKRNRHLLEEIQTRLSQAEHLIVPWGAAHMPELAREIQKAGFRMNETQEYVAIRFGSAGHQSHGAGKPGDSGKPR